MKVQIDAIVTKSETLKSESNSQEYNRQLTDNGVFAYLFSKFCVKKLLKTFFKIQNY